MTTITDTDALSEVTEELAKQRAINRQLVEALGQLRTALCSGPPEVVGYDRNGANQKAFNHGWNANANRLYEIASTAFAEVVRSTGMLELSQSEAG